RPDAIPWRIVELAEVLHVIDLTTQFVEREVLMKICLHFWRQLGHGRDPVPELAIVPSHRILALERLPIDAKHCLDLEPTDWLPNASFDACLDPSAEGICERVGFCAVR